jgi:hypothetical protein
MMSFRQWLILQERRIQGTLQPHPTDATRGGLEATAELSVSITQWASEGPTHWGLRIGHPPRASVSSFKTELDGVPSEVPSSLRKLMWFLFWNCISESWESWHFQLTTLCE